MRLGVDVSAIVRDGTGAERFIRPLTRHLARLLGVDDHITTFANDRRRLVSGIEGIPLVNPRWPARLLRFAWNGGYCGIERWLGPTDSYLANDWICPPRLRAGRLIVAVFDLAFRFRPDLTARSDRAVLEGQLRRWPARADCLLAISHATRRDLEAALGSDCPPVRVVYPGVDDDLREAAFREPDKATHVRLGLPPQYLLHVGTHAPRKNVDGLLRAYAAARALGVRVPLVLIGGGVGGDEWPRITGQLRDLGLVAWVRRLGHLPRGDVLQAMKAATVFLFPSLYEGFGFPVLEAMALGVPVITSKTTSLPEVGGEAPVYVDPQSPDEMAQAIHTLTADWTLRARLAAAGLAAANRFSWDRAARETLSLLRGDDDP